MDVNSVEERKSLLARLREFFGDVSRSAFLQKLWGRFSDSAETFDDEKEAIQAKPDAECNLPASPKCLDINGTDAWREHVAKVKDVSVLSEYIQESQKSMGNSSITSFIKSVKRCIDEEIPKFVGKHFKEPEEIEEDTSENVAEETGKLVKAHVLDLLRSCHNGIKYSRGKEKEFYEAFYDRLEQYLSSIGVYRKDIREGMDFNSNAKWFESPILKEPSRESDIGKIDEIEVFPYVIPYRDREPCEGILRGTCIAFDNKVKKK